jgi:hypothetical protein
MKPAHFKSPKSTLSEGTMKERRFSYPFFRFLGGSLLLMTLLCWVPAQTTAQKRPSDALFNQLASQEGITSMSFSRNIIELIDLDLSEEEDNSQKVTGPLQEISMIICSKEEAPGWSEKIMGFMQGKPFREVEPDTTEDQCNLFVHRKGKNIKACHVVFNGENTLVMISFFGKFKLEDIDRIAQKASELK